MIDLCPHCTQNLNFSETQRAKIKEALSRLPTGKLLKLTCPHCHEAIELDANGSTVSTNHHAGEKKPSRPGKQKITPPKAPGLDWLTSGKFDNKEIVTDNTRALVLVDKGSLQNQVVNALKDMDYKPIFPESGKDAIEQIQSINFSCIVLHSRYEGNSLSKNIFHSHMKKLAMDKRRSVFYALIGPEFQTLYGLEAISHSANLVVNEKEVKSLNIILKKAIPEYERLLDPYVDAMVTQGKKDANLWVDIRRKVRPRLRNEILKDLLMNG